MITDLSSAPPYPVLSRRSRAGCWRVIDYSGEGLSGKLLYAGPETNPPAVKPPMGLEGRHRVTVGSWGDRYARPVVGVKLTGAPCFKLLEREQSSPETIEKAFLTSADLTGKNLIIGPSHRSSGAAKALAYVRCEPMSAQ
jgi:hypothetical protein